MTVVVGTAGHIDHGKTTLLRALTGMDADRLPEEKRRGLTIDVGYARGAPDSGAVIDYVDVPGHDRLVGNMLVGAGEIDACMLVVAADDGPRAQTIEHLALLDAMGIDDGIAVVTKIDRVNAERTREAIDAVRDLLEVTRLAGSPIVAVSATTGSGLPKLRLAMAALRDRLASRIVGRGDGSRLSIDRVFSVRGFGVVVTGSARGTPLASGQRLKILPGQGSVRVRGLQVHDADVAVGPSGGRVALNITGAERGDLDRGMVVAAPDGAVVTTSRLLVALERPAPLRPPRDGPPWPPPDGRDFRLHVGTDGVDACIGRSGRDRIDLDDGRIIAVLRCERPIATLRGQRFVLRQPRPAELLAGGVILDPEPATGSARRRQTPERLAELDRAVHALGEQATEAASLALHGILATRDGVLVASDVRERLQTACLEAVATADSDDRERRGALLAELRRRIARLAGREASIPVDVALAAADDVIAGLVGDGRLMRDADVIRLPGRAAPAPHAAELAAGERLVSLLDTPAPPGLAAASVEAGAPSEVVRVLERDGRIVVVDDDLAWSRDAYDGLVARALELARSGPMTPAALRDATGTSRKYIMALLEDLARRGVLTRTPDGHVRGPRA